MVSVPVNATVCVKGRERYVLLYHDDQKTAALRTLARWATEKRLSFTWYDAAVLGQRIAEAGEDEP